MRPAALDGTAARRPGRDGHRHRDRLRPRSRPAHPRLPALGWSGIARGADWSSGLAGHEGGRVALGRIHDGERRPNVVRSLV